MGNAGGAMTGIVVGLKNSLGFGDVVPDLIQQYSQELNDIQQKTQDMINNQTLFALQQNVKIETDMFNFMKENTNLLKTMNQYTQELLWQKSTSNDVAIVILFSIILLLILFDLITVNNKK